MADVRLHFHDIYFWFLEKKNESNTMRLYTHHIAYVWVHYDQVAQEHSSFLYFKWKNTWTWPFLGQSKACAFWLCLQTPMWMTLPRCCPTHTLDGGKTPQNRNSNYVDYVCVYICVPCPLNWHFIIMINIMLQYTHHIHIYIHLVLCPFGPKTATCSHLLTSLLLHSFSFTGVFIIKSFKYASTLY